MSSDAIKQRQVSSLSVLTVARSHSDTIARHLGDCLGEEAAPATAVLLDRVIESLEGATNKMVQADAANGGGQAGGTSTVALARGDAMAEFDRTFFVAASILSDMLRVCGEKELAVKISPSTDKPGQTSGLAHRSKATSAA